MNRAALRRSDAMPSPSWWHISFSDLRRLRALGASDTVTVALGPFVHVTATVERVVLQRDSLPGTKAMMPGAG